MTRPTLTGTPDAVPTVELAELLEGGDLEIIDRWLAQADVVQIADELSRLARERRAVPFRLLARDRARYGLRAVYWATWLSRDRSRTDAFDYTGLSAIRRDGTVRRKPAFFSFRATARLLQGCAKAAVATRCR